MCIFHHLIRNKFLTTAIFILIASNFLNPTNQRLSNQNGWLTPTSLFAEENINVDSAKSTARELSIAFEDVSAKITNSVVNISAVTKTKRAKINFKNKSQKEQLPEQFRDFFGDDFFDRFFGLPGIPDGGGPRQGLGTGVIIDESGHIITNNHVIKDADEITVKLSDGRSFKATVVGSDARSDVAVIKIKASNIKPAKLGNSNSLKIGEWVVAVGNPFGLDNTITAGIVSAKGRAFQGGGQYEDFIQTDAAINPGNSGGPLVNLNGEVVGINTAIFSRSGGYMGIGFAIPINMAKSVVDSLIKTGKVVRGWLGLGIQPVNEDLGKSFGYNSTEGVLVGHVDPKGPANKAGITQGDIITEFQGEKVTNINQFRNSVAAVTPGTKAELTIFREGVTKKISVTVGELPANLGEAIDNPEVQPEPEQGASALGITVENLTAQIAKKLGSKRISGVVVTDVDPDGPAALSGIQAKDIIFKVGNQEVTNTNEFKKAVQSQNLKTGIRLLIESGGMDRFVLLKSE
ncbi:MAG TPA: DegQ family serine endoprotease [Oligoflexia bacterium]|nr:DegQ family serine endoprotease [Oligoflexia bacterium]HMP26612.1 DegQ family serine endoprotease [Oligoflexia bacterium]